MTLDRFSGVAARLVRKRGGHSAVCVNSLRLNTPEPTWRPDLTRSNDRPHDRLRHHTHSSMTLDRLSGVAARLVRERGADGAVRVDGLRLDVHRHRRGARKRQRRGAARDQRRIQAVLQAMVLRAPQLMSNLQ